MSRENLSVAEDAFEDACAISEHLDRVHHLEAEIEDS
jgi:hypothetical protein